MFTVYPKIYDESKLPERGFCKGKGIAAFTSGGDSQGMNAVLRSIVRIGLYLGCKMFLIKEGYQGMVDGGDNIVEATWDSVSAIIHKGGTVIGSARCMDFQERDGRLKAAKNLVQNGITHLVVIGGDGSLTGADLFKSEYPDLLSDLVSKGEITADQQSKFGHLRIAGIVGSIDNDFCGTDMTVGADSALHRITEAIDATISTAYSHKRAFILEVMGRHCGYLAIVAAMSCAADYLFIPESPVPQNWEEELCNKLKEERVGGQRLNIIIVSEGALDFNGQPITGDMVKKVIEDKLQQDTRVTVLGHVQRGGKPSAYDRIMGSRMGVEAVLALIEDDDPNKEACVITVNGNVCERKNLMECVRKTKEVAKAMEDKDWKKAESLRGENFQDNLKIYRMLKALLPPDDPNKPQATKGNYIFALMNIGAPAGGMNAVARSFIRYTLWAGDIVLSIHKGIEGLLKGQVQNMCWADVSGWVVEGGSMLGTKRTLAGENLAECARILGEYGINGLLIVGGFEAYQVGIEFSEGRKKHPEFCIPIVIIPATISNNVPGTEISLGSDTALNEIAKICDDIRQSAQGTHRRVFIAETMGGYCGYLATLAGLACGADAAYIFEEEATIKDLQIDLINMAAKMATGVITRGIILRNENSSASYNTDFLLRLYKEEGKGLFSCRQNIIGYAQQGGAPSPFDRNLGTKFAFKAKDYIMQQLKKSKQMESGTYRISTPESVVVLGFMVQGFCFTPVQQLKTKTDFKHRIPTEQWWLRLRLLLRTLATHETAYDAEEGAFQNKDRLLQKFIDMKEKADAAGTPVIFPECMSAFNPLASTYHNFIQPQALRGLTKRGGPPSKDGESPEGDADALLPVSSTAARSPRSPGGRKKGYLDVNVKINIK